MNNKKAFTLIELLVVVLIIGILAAVAVPQYQKAVWKSRNAQLKQLVKTVAQAEEAYYMANGKYAANFDELAIDLPLTSVTTIVGGHYSSCQSAVQENDSVRQGNDFYIALNSNDVTLSTMAVSAYWNKGPYKCAGFSRQLNGDSAELGIHCREKKNTSQYTAGKGAFCEKIERGTLVPISSDVLYFYSLP